MSYIYQVWMPGYYHLHHPYYPCPQCSSGGTAPASTVTTFTPKRKPKHRKED